MADAFDLSKVDPNNPNYVLMQFMQYQMAQQQEQHEKQMQQQKSFYEQQQQQQQLVHNQSIKGPQITPFDVTKKEQWEDWILVYKRSDFHKFATTDQERIDRLIVAMGVCGQSELTKCCMKAEDEGIFDKVVDALTIHFMGEKTAVYQRYLFHSRVQKEGEDIEKWIADVRNLGARCKFSKLTEIDNEMVSDRLIYGMRDQQLREALLADPKLSLERVLMKIRAREQSKRESQSIVALGTGTSTSSNTSMGSAQSALVENVGRNRSIRNTNNTNQNRLTGNQRPQSASSYRCFNCGAANYTSSHRAVCPARTVKCSGCSGIGHFVKFCRKMKNSNNRIHSISTDPNIDVEPVLLGDEYGVSEPDGSFFIGTVYECSHRMANVPQKRPSGPFVGRILFNGKLITVKFDSGAEVSVIPPHLVPPARQILPTSRRLCGAGESPLDVRGVVDISLANGSKKMTEKFYVVGQQRHILIGAPAISNLGILVMDQWSRIENVKPDCYGAKIIQNYPKLFSDRLGLIPYPYNIELEEGAVPYAIPIARNVAIPLRDAVTKELRRMIDRGVIEKVSRPTRWCAPMVVARKKNGEVRICTDFTQLNRYVRRPKAVLPNVELSLAAVGRATVFSKLDAASGFWQVPLEEECRDLTTFMTPIGRFRYRRLPFGITSAPEFFQVAMSDLLENLEGVTCHMDDVLVFGINQAQHDHRLAAVLRRMTQVGLVLNREKCVFSTSEVRFLGQIITGEYVRPDPDRVKAMAEFPRPTTVKGVRQLLGTLNQLSKFVPKLAEMSEPIRALLRKESVFRWGTAQQQAMERIVAEIKRTSDLIRYDLSARTAVVSDASNEGLGAVLLQTDSAGAWKPVCFGSRTLIPAEKNYASLEKEALAVTWAVEKFRCFLDGKAFEILTDHQPLVSLFGKKDLSQVPLRIQRFKIRLLPFVFTVRHVPGKDLHTADFLSRHPLPYDAKDVKNAADVEAYVQTIACASTTMSAVRREQVRKAQENDEKCQFIKPTLLEGWPKYNKQIPIALREWAPYKNEISTFDGILHWNNRVIIPDALRPFILELIHEGHLGIARCLGHAKLTVFWPSLTRDITKVVEDCETCRIHRATRRAPLLHHERPDAAWLKVGADIFFFKDITYLIIVDYFSGYFDVIQIPNMSANTVIHKVKEVFGRWGIPQTFVTDSGTQFAAAEWQEFSRQFGFDHVMSSPHYHQSNGAAERAVKTAKLLMSKSDDFNLALLAFRSSPNSSGFSPAELMMGRRIRGKLPFVPRRMDASDFKRVAEWRSNQQNYAKSNYDLRHQVCQPQNFYPGERVYVSDLKTYTLIEKAASTPRSWILRSSNGRLIRRNQQFLVKVTAKTTTAPNSSSPLLDLDSGDSFPEQGTTTLEDGVPLPPPSSPAPSRSLLPEEKELVKTLEPETSTSSDEPNAESRVPKPSTKPKPPRPYLDTSNSLAANRTRRTPKPTKRYTELVGECDDVSESPESSPIERPCRSLTSSYDERS